MELPLRDAAKKARRLAKGNRGANKHGIERTSRRDNGVMFDSSALEHHAQSSVDQADERADEIAAMALNAAPGSQNSKQPYAVTRPGGRLVINPEEQSQEQRPRNDARNTARKTQDVATYNPSHPSVLFHRLKQSVAGAIDFAAFRARLTGWLRKPTLGKNTPRRFMRPARSERTRLVQHRSGLIIPRGGEPFMLTETHDTMSSLVAENQRLRLLVDEIIRTDPQEIARLRR